MAHSVSKTSAGFGGTGELKFSQLRKKFKRKSSGVIKASELFRITDTDLKKPLIPDCKENEDAGVPGAIDVLTTIAKCKDNEDIDWRISQMRSVITHYTIDQTGTNTDLVGTSLTWNTNLTRNIRKTYFIDGTIKASLYDKSALTFKKGASSPIVNLTVDFGTSGSIKGAGGPGGGTWEEDYGADGGTAFNFDSPNGKNNKITLDSNANWLQIGGGGGGGGKGGTGANGSTGVCYKPRINRISSKYTGAVSLTGKIETEYNPGPWGEWYTFKYGGKCQCEYYIKCPDPANTSYNRPVTITNGQTRETTTYNSKGYQGNHGFIGGSNHYTFRSHRSRGGCKWKWVPYPGYRKTCIDGAYCAITDPEAKPGAPGGAGGNGGRGQGGDGNQTDGVNGIAGTPANCPTYSTRGENGRRGGNGGNWGEDGKSGDSSWLGENNWDSNPGGLAYKLSKYNYFTGQYEPYINDSTDKEVNSVESANQNPNWDKVKAENWWGWTDFLMKNGIYRSPIPDLEEKDPHIDKWLEIMIGINLVYGRYKLEIEADGIGKIMIKDNSNNLIKNITGNPIGDAPDVGRRVAMHPTVGIASEEIIFHIDDWLGKFYKDNNIGGQGGDIENEARWYWQEQVRIAQDSGLSLEASREKVKDTIEATARSPEENSWNLSSTGNGVGTLAFNMGADYVHIRSAVKNGARIEGASSAGGKAGIAINGTGYTVSGYNSYNLKGDYKPD
jgi:hypothetical protein